MDLCWGIVVDIDDPVYAQRVKVRIYGYYDNIPESDLPWCPTLRDSVNALTFNTGTANHNLLKGTQVLCAWLDEYNQQPIVLGSVPRITDCDNMTDLNQTITRTKSGHEIIVNNDVKDNYILVRDKYQNCVKMSKDGITISSVNDIDETAKNNKSITIDKDLNIVANNCNITCNEQTVIDAKEVSIKNIKGPNQFCCLPNCLFAGTKHISPSTDEEEE